MTDSELHVLNIGDILYIPMDVILAASQFWNKTLINNVATVTKIDADSCQLNLDDGSKFAMTADNICYSGIHKDGKRGGRAHRYIAEDLLDPAKKWELYDSMTKKENI